MTRIQNVLTTAALDVDAEALLGRCATAVRLTMNFHPDRLLGDGRSVAQALFEEGVYRSQFEISISNGGLAAYTGGDRDAWEDTLFAGAYQAPGVATRERPKYAA